MKTLKRFIMSEIFVTFSKGDGMFAQGIFFSWSYEGCGWVLVSSAGLPFSYINEEASFAHTHFFYYISRTSWPLLRIYNHIPIDTWLCSIFCEIIHSHSLHSSYILLSPLVTKQISFRSDPFYWYNCMSSCCCWEQDLHLAWVSEAVNLKAKITPCWVSQIQNQVIWGRSCLCVTSIQWQPSDPQVSHSCREEHVFYTLKRSHLNCMSPSVSAVNMWKISSIYEESSIASIGVWWEESVSV